MIISTFLISPFDRVQTTLFNLLFIFRVIGSPENDNRHTIISFRILWWESWVLVTSEVPRHLNDDSGNSGIPRTSWAFQEPFWPAPGPMGPTIPARDPWVPIGPYIGPIGPYIGPYRALYRALFSLCGLPSLKLYGPSRGQ